MRTHPKQGPTKFRQRVFVVGILVEARCYYSAKHDNATLGSCPRTWQVPSRFCRRVLRPQFQRGVQPRFRRTRAHLPIGQQKRIPQNGLEHRTTIPSTKRSVRFMDNMTTEVPLAHLQPFSAGSTRA
jgi:hypothetical protein